MGKEALLKHFEFVVKVFDLDNSHLDQVKVLDNENIELTGHWEGTLKLPDQPPQPQAGFWVDTATKQKDGNWKLSMDGYNVKPPPPAARTH
jgi:ketosteroid isomerase-like protein